MTKKRATIYVAVEVWKEIRMRALELDLSAGDFLVGCYLEKLASEPLEKLPIRTFAGKETIPENEIETRTDDLSVPTTSEDSDEFFKPLPKTGKKK